MSASRLVAGGGFRGARRIGIDDGGELRACGFVDHAAVVLAEGSGADDGDSSVVIYARRTHDGDPAFVRLLQHRLRLSSIRVRPASTASTVVPVSCITGIVSSPPPARRTADARGGAPLSPAPCGGRSPGVAARRSMASVPSMASTATQARSQMATLWPTSKPASALATRRPYSISVSSSFVGLAAGHDAGAGQQRLQQHGGIAQLNAFVRQDLDDAADQAIGVFRRQGGEQFHQAPVGAIEEKIFACFTWPHIMTSVMPSRLQISISLLSWPSEIQWQRSASASTSWDASSWMAIDDDLVARAGGRFPARAGGSGRCRRSVRTSLAHSFTLRRRARWRG